MTYEEINEEASMTDEERMRVAKGLTSHQLVTLLVESLGWDRVTLQRASHTFDRVQLEDGRAEIGIEFHRVGW